MSLPSLSGIVKKNEQCLLNKIQTNKDDCIQKWIKTKMSTGAHDLYKYNTTLDDLKFSLSLKIVGYHTHNGLSIFEW